MTASVLRRCGRVAVATVALAALAGLAAVAGIPGPGAQPVRAQGASPLLPAEHWTAPLLVRLHALGVGIGDPVPTVRTADAATSALPASWAARLAAERRAVVGTLHLEPAAHLSVRSGQVAPGGFTPDRQWTGPRPARPEPSVAVRARAAAVPVSWLAGAAEVTASPDGVLLEHATVSVAAGPFGAWAGRRAVGYAPGAGGGLVLNGLARFDGAGAALARAIELPVIGAFTAESFAGPVASNGLVARPWLLAMRIHARPHPRFDVGATRAAVFGGMGAARIGARELATVLVGANLSGEYADDQVASADARWRPPLGRLAAELYGEWGMHDIDAEVFIDVPAFTLGVRVPRAVQTALGELGAGLEHTQISGSCCGNPPWYHHFELADGWAVDGVLLGHPLGGQGREWRASVSAAASDARVLVEAAAAVRTRGAENVFAPDRRGRAMLFELAADTRLTAALAAELSVVTERGTGWSAVRSSAAVRWRL